MIYDCKCDQCGRMEEIHRSVADRDKDLPECCGSTMRRVISVQQNVHPDFEPYFDENLGTQDTPGEWVKSKQHRKQLLQKHGLSEAYGKGWV